MAQALTLGPPASTSHVIDFHTHQVHLTQGQGDGGGVRGVLPKITLQEKQGLQSLWASSEGHGPGCQHHCLAAAPLLVSPTLRQGDFPGNTCKWSLPGSACALLELVYLDELCLSSCLL